MMPMSSSKLSGRVRGLFLDLCSSVWPPCNDITTLAVKTKPYLGNTGSNGCIYEPRKQTTRSKYSRFNDNMLSALRSVLPRIGTFHLHHKQTKRSFAMDAIKATVYENFGGT